MPEENEIQQEQAKEKVLTINPRLKSFITHGLSIIVAIASTWMVLSWYVYAGIMTANEKAEQANAQLAGVMPMLLQELKTLHETDAAAVKAHNDGLSLIFQLSQNVGILTATVTNLNKTVEINTLRLSRLENNHHLPPIQLKEDKK